MADNVAVTAGSGTSIATQDRSGVHLQQVIDTGSDTVANGHVTMSSTAATLLAARVNRRRVVIVNYQTVPIYVGIATVTTANGVRLDPGTVAEFRSTALLQGITAAAYTAAGEDDKVHYWEEYD